MRRFALAVAILLGVCVGVKAASPTASLTITVVSVPTPTPAPTGLMVTVSQALNALPSQPIPTPAAGGQTYYVSASGNDSNSGTSAASPFLTIGKANATMSGGDVAVLMPGTYTGTFALTKPGTSAHYTTLIAEPGQARPVVVGPSGSTGIILQVNNTPYVRVSGVAVTCANHSTDTANALEAYGTHHVQFDHDFAYDCGGAGIAAGNMDYMTIEDSIAYGNANAQPNEDSGFDITFFVNYDTAAGYHNYFLRNIGFDNFNIAPINGQTYTTDGEGMILDTFDLHAYTSASLVAGNLFFGNGGSGIEVVNSSSGIDILNNTCYSDALDTNGHYYPHSSAEIRIQSAANGVNVKNNVVNGATASNYTLFANASTGTITWSNNVSGTTGTAAANGGAPAISSTTNKLNVDPIFADATTNQAAAQFTLQAGSPAQNYGAPLSFSMTDLAGNVAAAGSAINAGAYLK